MSVVKGKTGGAFRVDLIAKAPKKALVPTNTQTPLSQQLTVEVKPESNTFILSCRTDPFDRPSQGGGKPVEAEMARRPRVKRRGRGIWKSWIRVVTVAGLGPVRDIYNHLVTRSTCTFQIELERRSRRARRGSNVVTQPIRSRSPRRRTKSSAGRPSQRGMRAACKPGRSSRRFTYDPTSTGTGSSANCWSSGRGRPATTLSSKAPVPRQVARVALQGSLGFERVAYFREVGYSSVAG